ncbi:unnamed protein product, partial [Arabidopsis halleri]
LLHFTSSTSKLDFSQFQVTANPYHQNWLFRISIRIPNLNPVAIFFPFLSHESNDANLQISCKSSSLLPLLPRHY